ncbi:MAG: tetratricopeptide repeat protein [Burkholderiaceae bacterium]
MKRTRLLLCALLLAAFAAPSQAGEAELQAFVLSHQHAALETLARGRLALDPLDEAALWYWGLDAASQPRLRVELLGRAQDCVRSKPGSARCQHLWGVLIASRFMEDIDLTALSGIGEVREHFENAVALAPQDYAMRHDLQAFYLEVPAVLGGSNRKARAQADAFASIDPSRALLLRAEIAISNKDFDSAESLLAGIQAGGNPLLARDLQSVQVDLGCAMLEGDATVRARALFERLLQQDAQSPDLYVGLGRSLSALKQGTSAVAAFERALQLDPSLHIQHRMATAAELAGNKPKAIAAWQRVLVEPAESAHADHAHDRLVALQR